MKKIVFLVLVISYTVMAVLLSCKKEYSCEGCRGTNIPPNAVAGPDQTITLPTDTVLLDGSRSSDPDGKITKWLWTKISGPASVSITNASKEITVVKNLIAGVYQFELKVTDDKNTSAKDTVMITIVAAAAINHPPIANAGTDKTIILPTNTVSLDGSASSDPDNNITGYQWAKISGPPSAGIASANAVQTQVNNLAEGVYQFELTVTDAGGLSSKDTMQISVNSAAVLTICDYSDRPKVSAQLVPIGTLSNARTGMAVASAGNKILFAGGKVNGVWGSGVPSSRIDIFDIASNTWSIAELCVERYEIAAIAAGNKIFFAGGEYGDGTWPVDSVDIYDVSSNTWTVNHLSEARNGIAAAAVENRVLFAGGDQGTNGSPANTRGKRVDIYNLSTGTWSTASLSETKVGGHTAVAANNKVYVAGGETWEPDPTNPGYNRWYPSGKVDIYDNATNSWSVSYMKEGRIFFDGIAYGEKIYWAGGDTKSGTTCSVEIRDINSGNSTIQYLFRPALWYLDAGQTAVIKSNKIIFYRPNGSADRNKFDIFDTNSGTWSIGVLGQAIPLGASIISVNNTIYLAGGSLNGILTNQVYKLEF